MQGVLYILRLWSWGLFVSGTPGNKIKIRLSGGSEVTYVCPKNKASETFGPEFASPVCRLHKSVGTAAAPTALPGGHH